MSNAQPPIAPARTRLCPLLSVLFLGAVLGSIVGGAIGCYDVRIERWRGRYVHVRDRLVGFGLAVEESADLDATARVWNVKGRWLGGFMTAPFGALLGLLVFAAWTGEGCFWMAIRLGGGWGALAALIGAGTASFCLVVFSDSFDSHESFDWMLFLGLLIVVLATVTSSIIGVIRVIRSYQAPS
ncbi:hypothetical protein AYO44_17235 [Planctomycetaceae bacterium SCGC AG-212-F19]|nr:hypothetical protein AYO44_17235 [Planctomycetaceae bacterium SCGC AG-212-F19]